MTNKSFNEIDIRKSLSDKFVDIIMKHGEASWATDELYWLVYDKYRWMYEQLDECHRLEVDTYMVALKLLHGGK
jgi:hypothetical protein